MQQTTDRMGVVRPPAPQAPTTRSRGPIVLIVVLAIALVAAVTWAVVERNREEAPSAQAMPTSAQIVAAVNDSVAAWNSGDADAVSAVYAPAAVFDDLITPDVSNGVDEIAATAADMRKEMGGPGWLKMTSLIAVYGDTATYAFTYGDSETAVGIALLVVDNDGMITHQIVRAVDGVRIAA